MLIYNVTELPAEMKTSASANKAAKSAELHAAFNLAINSDIFMSFDEKVKGLLDVLSIPISDDQSYNQFFIHSDKDLKVAACTDAINRNTVPVLPTLGQIHAEAQKRYDDKATKAQRQADKKAAKDAKSAPAIPPVAQAA
jgi:hypothetical protein